MTFDQARDDHVYLWQTYGAAYDMTGGYVDQHDLWRLLENPSKTTARKCYEDQIQYWFESGCDEMAFRPDSIDWTDSMIREIAERHGIDQPTQ